MTKMLNTSNILSPRLTTIKILSNASKLYKNYMASPSLYNPITLNNLLLLLTQSMRMRWRNQGLALLKMKI